MLQSGLGSQGGVCMQLLIGSGGIDLPCKQVVLLALNPRLPFSFLVEARTGWLLALCKWAFGYEQGSCNDINDW